MASSKQVLLLLAAVACLASPLASATQWMVGDEGGWRAKFNLTGWADGKTFVVGDTLRFMYPKGNHTVVQVGKDDFAACNLQGNWLGLWDSGDDVVTLDKPGKVWFICTKPNHCLNGMKLVVDVVSDNSAPAPSPFPFPFPFPGVPAPQPPSFVTVCPFPFPFCGPAPAPAPETSSLRKSPFPFPGVPAPAPAPETSSLRKSPFPFPGVPAPAPSPLFRFPSPYWPGSAPAPAPESPEATPRRLRP